MTKVIESHHLTQDGVHYYSILHLDGEWPDRYWEKIKIDSVLYFPEITMPPLVKTVCIKGKHELTGCEVEFI